MPNNKDFIITALHMCEVSMMYFLFSLEIPVGKRKKSFI